MASHQRVLPFSLSNAFASCTDLVLSRDFLPYHILETSPSDFPDYSFWCFLVWSLWRGPCQQYVIPPTTLHEFIPWTALLFLFIDYQFFRDIKFHKNVFSSCPASALLAIEYISAKYVPLENTCAYWFPSNDCTLPYMVSVAHMPVSLLVCNTLSALFCLARGITAEQVSLCVILGIVSLTCSILIYHRSLISSDDMVELRPINWNVLDCGTSCTIAFNSNKLLDGVKATLTLPIIWLVMAPLSYIWSTKLLSLYVLVRSGYTPSVMTAPMFLDISSSRIQKLLGKQTFYVTYSCTDKQVTHGHVCSSLSVGFLVVTPSIVPFEDNGSINSWSSAAMKIGDSEKGLSWTLVPYARNWLGFTRVWSVASRIHIALLGMRIVVSPVLGLLYTVAAWNINTAFIVSCASVYGATSHSYPVKCIMMKLETQTIVSKCESRYIMI